MKKCEPPSGKLPAGYIVCPKTGRVFKAGPRGSWPVWGFSALGLLSLLWFLVRVIPKPSLMSKAARSVGGGDSDAAAWDAIFRYFNLNHGKGERGYQAGEKIAIKINLTTCNGRSGTDTVDINGTYEKQNAYCHSHEFVVGRD